MTVVKTKRDKRKVFCKLMAYNYLWLCKSVVHIAHPTFVNAKSPNLDIFMEKDGYGKIQQIVLSHSDLLKNREMEDEIVYESFSVDLERVLKIAQKKVPKHSQIRNLLEDCVKRFDYWNDQLVERVGGGIEYYRSNHERQKYYEQEEGS